MSRELILRIVTAVILVSVVLFILLKGNQTLYNSFILLVISLAAWEWANFAQIKTKSGKLIYLGFILVLLGLAHFIPSRLGGLFFLFVGVAWWVFALIWVPFFPKYTKLLFNKWLALLAGVMVLVPLWPALVFYVPRESVLFLLLLIWSADIGAYFSGRAFGKHKLMPKVSPGKTWQGVIGGLVLAIVVLGFYGGWNFSYLSLVQIVVVVIFSVVGDLVESTYKRSANLKDSGSLLPGHGGILDRIDSLTAAAPMMAFLSFF